VKHNPFAGLRDQLGLPPGETTASEPAAAAPDGPSPIPRRAVVRMERSGRGGKAVTVVEQLALPPETLAVWLKDLKHALGCGGSVEGEALVIQGDQRPRVQAWLSARGIRKVTMG